MLQIAGMWESPLMWMFQIKSTLLGIPLAEHQRSAVISWLQLAQPLGANQDSILVATASPSTQ